MGSLSPLEKCPTSELPLGGWVSSNGHPEPSHHAPGAGWASAQGQKSQLSLSPAPSQGDPRRHHPHPGWLSAETRVPAGDACLPPRGSAADPGLPFAFRKISVAGGALDQTASVPPPQDWTSTSMWGEANGRAGPGQLLSGDRWDEECH